MQNILNHNRLPFTTKLNLSEYWDFSLYLKQSSCCLDNGDECLAAFIDTNMNECLNGSGLKSLNRYNYSECVNNGIEYNNIGFTGMDNGLITFNKYEITIEEFEELLTKSVYKIDSGDCRLKINKVDGNTKVYDYHNTLIVDDGVRCAELNGGFYQGIFSDGKGCDYKILPTKLEGSGWTLEFTLKRKDFENKHRILNNKHPENKGIFFYMGTRAENKWLKYYNSECDNVCKEENNPQETLLDIDKTNSGTPLSAANVFEIETGNKFVLFDRTCNGVTTQTYQEGDTAVIQYKNVEPKENYFTLFNRSCTGLTVNDYEDYVERYENEYNIYNDLYRNAFALQIKDDGSIGYKYLVKDCDSESTACSYKIETEFSNKGVVKYDEWVKIDVNFIPLKNDKMRLMFYIDGKLKLVSKELDIFNFRTLNETQDKQEMVPFNISIGGGTQGLSEVIYNDFMHIPTCVYPLELEFGGSFIGYFRTFKFYECKLNYTQINQTIYI